MTIRRQLLNFGGKHTDFRVGAGALEELPRMVKGTVATPHRALFVAQPEALERCGEPVRRGLADAGFSVEEVEVAGVGAASTFAEAARLYEALDELAISAEDLIIGLGDAATCGLVSFCAGSWLGGTVFALIPTTLDAMVCSATVMTGLSTTRSRGVVSVQPAAALVVSDLSLVEGLSVDELGLGLVHIVASYLMDSKRSWERVEEAVAGLATGETFPLVGAICDTQTARVNAIKATSPSARCAMLFGTTTAGALRSCLGAEVPEYLLYAEGLRFEARVAVDACGFEVDEVFKLDDCLEELGIEELPFALETDAFVAALKAERFRRANRFMLPLPKRPGFIRLTTVEDEVLENHAEAYLASRAELL